MASLPFFYFLDTHLATHYNGSIEGELNGILIDKSPHRAPDRYAITAMTPVEIIDSLAGLVSAAAACLAPLLALIAALGGAFLGAYLQRKSSEEARRSMRAERSVQEKAQPITDYLHHVSVLVSLQPYLRDLDEDEKAPGPIRHVFEDSLTSALRLQGPANVHVRMLDDKELLDKINKATALSEDLVSGVQSQKPIKQLTKLWIDCTDAITDAKARLEHVIEKATETK